jgi:hypothetical protein
MGLHSTVVLLGLLMMAGGAVLFFATQHRKLGLTLAARHSSADSAWFWPA